MPERNAVPHPPGSSAFLRRCARVGQVLFQSVKSLYADHGAQWAAAIAYYSFLSIFPLLLAVISLSAYFVNPDWAVAKTVALLQEFVPKGGGAVGRIVHDAATADSVVEDDHDGAYQATAHLAVLQADTFGVSTLISP